MTLLNPNLADRKKLAHDNARRRIDGQTDRQRGNSSKLRSSLTNTPRGLQSWHRSVPGRSCLERLSIPQMAPAMGRYSGIRPAGLAYSDTTPRKTFV